MTAIYERITTLVRGAREAVERPNSAPVVADHIVLTHWDDLTGDRVLHRAVMREGIIGFVRDDMRRRPANAAQHEDTAQLRLDQIEAWPGRVRDLVRSIGRAEVFVPSRAEYVELIPDAMSAGEIAEAGHYLIRHGEEAIRRGRALLRLAQEMPPAAAAA